MKKKELAINFSLVKIEENQFSVFEETLALENPIEQEIGFGFGVNTEEKVLGVNMEFMLKKEDKPLLKQDITCYFAIDAPDFEKKLRKEDQISIPCNFGKHLAMITTGTLRGVLFANTKNTAFNEFLIGLINVDSMFENDIIIKL